MWILCSSINWWPELIQDGATNPPKLETDVTQINSRIWSVNSKHHHHEKGRDTTAGIIIITKRATATGTICEGNIEEANRSYNNKSSKSKNKLPEKSGGSLGIWIVNFCSRRFLYLQLNLLFSLSISLSAALLTNYLTLKIDELFHFSLKIQFESMF